MKIPLLGVKISLAVKVGLLFAAAVLLIVSAALFVSWDRMQRLATAQDVAEAGHFATIRLLERHPFAMSAAPASPPAAGRLPAVATTTPASGPDSRVDTPGRLARGWAQLRPDEQVEAWPTSRFYVPVPSPDDKTLPHFVRNAITRLRSDKGAAAPSEFYQYSLDKPPGGERDQEVLEYVRGLRISGQCAVCHVGSNAARPFQNNELVGLIYVRMPSVEQPLDLPLGGRISVNLAVAIGAGVIAVILAVIVFYVIIQSLVLSPVRKLRRLADHIGEGDLSVRSTINTGDEFERLSKAFNSMLERLQISQQQMRQINESLNSKMDELAKANVALFESNRLKSEFLARVSHELRTPLNSIIGFAEVLRDQMAETQAVSPGDAQAGKAARYADNILTSGRMLLELINDLLDLSKIEAGKMVVRYEKVVIADLVEAVIRFMRPAADKKNLRVTVTVAPDLPLMETDGGKLQQILYNLFSNAVKFTPPRGSVSVSAWRESAGEGEELVLAVRDTGPGIPPEDQQAIFEKFHQLDSPATREHGGTGLGLAISRELAEMLGGRISLVSKLGEGSTFSVTLPLKPPAAPGDK